MQRLPGYIALSLIILSSCSDKYQAFKAHYTFVSRDGKSDYSNLDYWAAHPWKWDPSDSVPNPLRNETDINLFYLNIRENISQRIKIFWKEQVL